MTTWFLVPARLRRHRTMWAVLTLGLVTTLGLSALAVVPRLAHAATTTITTCDAATLSGAISSSASGDILKFGCNGTITLPSTLTISHNLTLDGDGHSVTLDGNNAVQVLMVNTGISFTLNDLTISRGNSNFGGGLENKGTVTITNSTFFGNYAMYNGGGLINLPSGTVAITNSIFSGNKASPATGTGVGFDNQGTATITNSTFIGNTNVGTTPYSGGLGGGFTNETSATATISGSTFSGNAAATGAGIYDFGALTITNSTITGNSASDHVGGVVVTNNGATATITNSTIAGNTVPASVGYPSSIANLSNGGAVTLANTIVANGIGGDNCGDNGTLTDSGHNLDSGTTCGFSSAKHDLSSTNPMLGALGNNGGPTQTLALLPGSPAIDAGGSSSNGCPATDQRGVSRPQGAACDIGAYEFVATTSTTLSANPNSVVAGQSVQLCATVTPTNNSGTPPGNVVFKDGSTTLGTATLSGGNACLSTTSLSIGTHSITAAYAGGSGFSGSTSAPQQVVVGVYGQDVMGSASGNGSGNPASGNSPDTTSAPGAPAVSAGSGQTNSSGQPSGQGRQPTPPSPYALWWALGLVVMLLGLGGLGVVLYRTRRTATH